MGITAGILVSGCGGTHSRPEIVAHRGASADAPENTLAAVRLAWQRGADAVEVDVHLTSDNRLVVIHDATTRRTARRQGEVRSMTLEELQHLDVGAWKGPAWTGQRIPTLGEVLATVPEGKRLFVEIKSGPETVAPLTATVADSSLRTEQVAVIDFDLATVAAAKKALPDHRVYWLVGLRRARGGGAWTPPVDQLIARVREAGLDGLNVRACPGVTPASVDAVHAAGLELYVWTVDDPDQARRFHDAGVDGITTNRPARLRGPLENR